MRVESIRTNFGPSVFHSKSTIVMTVDLENWSEVSSHTIPYFVSALLEKLPGLKQHTCSKGYPGGFVQRLNDGTYLAHIIEHMALELSSICSIEVFYGKTRYAGRTGLYDIVTRYKNEKGMQTCLLTAVELAQALLEKKAFDLTKATLKIKNIVAETALGSTTKALLEAVKKRHIPYRLMGDGSLLQLGYGKKKRRLQTAVTDETNLISADIAQDKLLTKKILEENFIPVPQGGVVSEERELLEVLSSFEGPYVVKPIDGNHGRGVSLNLKTKEEVTKAFHLAKEISEKVIIEEMCAGHDYRMLVVGGKLVAASERKPPMVVGDGKKTLCELIEELNQDPRRGSGHENVLSKVEVDDVMKEFLKKRNITWDSVIGKDQWVQLRENANLSSGGTAKDVTDKVHPEVVRLCERAARQIGLDICGLDLIHTDISLPVEKGAKIIEVNAGPGLRMHLAPSDGQARPVADLIINKIFPHTENGRVPIVSVTGTNGKTTTVRLIHKIMSQLNQTVGLTTTDGIWIGQEKIYSGDTTGPKSAQVVLSDPKVDVAVLEVARGGMLRGGLGYDWSDVAVITNIKEDHIGQNGIEDIDDLVWIKSLIAERLKAGGVLVLNADDETTLAVQFRPRVQQQHSQIFLFSLSLENVSFRRHIERGGKGCSIDNGWIVIFENMRSQRLMPVADIPLTMEGRARFNVANALAATAASLSMGVSVQQIRQGLQSFKAAEENLGRFNLYKVRNSYVILDYGHNEDAFSAIGDLIGEFPGYKKKAILSLPGDRSDELIIRSARKVASFCDEIYLRDDIDLRGRQPLEVPTMCVAAITEASINCQTELIRENSSGIYKVLDRLEEKQILILFYDDIDEVSSVLRNYDPQPVDVIPDLIMQRPQYNSPNINTFVEEQTHARSF